MLSHILEGLKELLTEATLKGPFFSVCSLVELNLCCSFEALLIFVATERSFVTVHCIVVPKYDCSSRTLSAQCIFEWCFFIVCKSMLFKIFRCHESTFTLGTFERSFTFCVSFFVFLDICKSLEALLAQTAFKGSFITVNHLVIYKCFSGFKVPTALITL